MKNIDFDIVTEISDKITEVILKDSALTHKPHDIYEIIEGDEFDAITYDYYKVYFVKKEGIQYCPYCGRKLDS